MPPTPTKAVALGPPARGKGGGRPAKKKEEGDDVRKQQNLVSGFDFRQWLEHTSEDPFTFWKVIQKHFKKVTWQLERSPENGMLHWQGRGTLWKQIRGDSAEAMQIAQEMFGHHGWYFKPTTKEEHIAGLARYQNKCATRVLGPWSDEDPPKFKNADVLHLDKIGLAPWQEEIVEICKAELDPRTIHCIVDTIGDHGKTALVAFLHFYGIAYALQYMPSYKDFIQYCYGCTGHKAYVVNIVKAINGNDPKQVHEFAQFLGAIESLKDGQVCDGRNKHRDPIHFDRPHIVLCMNDYPLLDKATMGRWRLYNIVDGHLVDVTDERQKIFYENSLRATDRNEKARLKKERREAAAWDKFVADDPDNEDVKKFLERQAARKEANDIRNAKRLKKVDDTVVLPVAKKPKLTLFEEGCGETPVARPGQWSDVKLVFEEEASPAPTIIDSDEEA